MWPELIDAAATIWIGVPALNVANWAGLVKLTTGRASVGGGVGVGVVSGVGVGVGVVSGVGVGVGVVSGVGVVLSPEPLQALPLTVKLVGTGLLVVQVPLKPGWTDPFAATLPFHAIFVTVTFWPDCENAPFHPCATVWPLAGKAKFRLQLDHAEPLVFWIVMPAPKPPGHRLVTVYVTWQ
jgi:hypothetical protein